MTERKRFKFQSSSKIAKSIILSAYDDIVSFSARDELGSKKCFRITLINLLRVKDLLKFQNDLRELQKSKLFSNDFVFNDLDGKSLEYFEKPLEVLLSYSKQASPVELDYLCRLLAAYFRDFGNIGILRFPFDDLMEIIETNANLNSKPIFMFILTYFKVHTSYILEHIHSVLKDFLPWLSSRNQLIKRLSMESLGSLLRRAPISIIKNVIRLIIYTDGAEKVIFTIIQNIDGNFTSKVQSLFIFLFEDLIPNGAEDLCKIAENVRNTIQVMSSHTKDNKLDLSWLKNSYENNLKRLTQDICESDFRSLCVVLELNLEMLISLDENKFTSVKNYPLITNGEYFGVLLTNFLVPLLKFSNRIGKGYLFEDLCSYLLRVVRSGTESTGVLDHDFAEILTNIDHNLVGMNNINSFLSLFEWRLKTDDLTQISFILLVLSSILNNKDIFHPLIVNPTILDRVLTCIELLLKDLESESELGLGLEVDSKLDLELDIDSGIIDEQKYLDLFGIINGLFCINKVRIKLKAVRVEDKDNKNLYERVLIQVLKGLEQCYDSRVLLRIYTLILDLMDLSTSSNTSNSTNNTNTNTSTNGNSSSNSTTTSSNTTSTSNESNRWIEKLVTTATTKRPDLFHNYFMVELLVKYRCTDEYVVRRVVESLPNENELLRINVIKLVQLYYQKESCQKENSQIYEHLNELVEMELLNNDVENSRKKCMMMSRTINTIDFEGIRKEIRESKETKNKDRESRENKMNKENKETKESIKSIESKESRDRNINCDLFISVVKRVLMSQYFVKFSPLWEGAFNANSVLISKVKGFEKGLQETWELYFSNLKNLEQGKEFRYNFTSFNSTKFNFPEFKSREFKHTTTNQIVETSLNYKSREKTDLVTIQFNLLRVIVEIIYGVKDRESKIDELVEYTLEQFKNKNKIEYLKNSICTVSSIFTKFNKENYRDELFDYCITHGLKSSDPKIRESSLTIISKRYKVDFKRLGEMCIGNLQQISSLTSTYPYGDLGFGLESELEYKDKNKDTGKDNNKDTNEKNKEEKEKSEDNKLINLSIGIEIRLLVPRIYQHSNVSHGNTVIDYFLNFESEYVSMMLIELLPNKYSKFFMDLSSTTNSNTNTSTSTDGSSNTTTTSSNTTSISNETNRWMLKTMKFDEEPYTLHLPNVLTTVNLLVKRLVNHLKPHSIGIMELCCTLLKEYSQNEMDLDDTRNSDSNIVIERSFKIMMELVRIFGVGHFIDILVKYSEVIVELTKTFGLDFVLSCTSQMEWIDVFCTEVVYGLFPGVFEGKLSSKQMTLANNMYNSYPKHLKQNKKHKGLEVTEVNNMDEKLEDTVNSEMNESIESTENHENTRLSRNLVNKEKSEKSEKEEMMLLMIESSETLLDSMSLYGNYDCDLISCIVSLELRDEVKQKALDILLTSLPTRANMNKSVNLNVKNDIELWKKILESLNSCLCLLNIDEKEHICKIWDFVDNVLSLVSDNGCRKLASRLLTKIPTEDEGVKYTGERLCSINGVSAELRLDLDLNVEVISDIVEDLDKKSLSFRCINTLVCHSLYLLWNHNSDPGVRRCVLRLCFKVLEISKERMMEFSQSREDMGLRELSRSTEYIESLDSEEEMDLDDTNTTNSNMNTNNRDSNTATTSSTTSSSNVMNRNISISVYEDPKHVVGNTLLPFIRRCLGGKAEDHLVCLCLEFLDQFVLVFSSVPDSDFRNSFHGLHGDLLGNPGVGDCFHKMRELQKYKRCRGLKQLQTMVESGYFSNTTLLKIIIPICLQFLIQRNTVRHLGLSDMSKQCLIASCSLLPVPSFIKLLKKLLLTYSSCKLPIVLAVFASTTKEKIESLVAYNSYTVNSTDLTKSNNLSNTAHPNSSTDSTNTTNASKTTDPNDRNNPNNTTNSIDDKSNFKDQLGVGVILGKLKKMSLVAGKKKVGDVPVVEVFDCMGYLLQYYPESIVSRELIKQCRILSKFLVSRNRDVRRLARLSLINLAKPFGTKYIDVFIRELFTNMAKGYKCSVLIFTIYSILNKILDDKNVLTINNQLRFLYSMILDEISRMQEKDDSRSKIDEARHPKSSQLMSLITQYSTSEVVESNFSFLWALLNGKLISNKTHLLEYSDKFLRKSNELIVSATSGLIMNKNVDSISICFKIFITFLPNVRGIERNMDQFPREVVESYHKYIETPENILKDSMEISKSENKLVEDEIRYNNRGENCKGDKSNKSYNNKNWNKNEFNKSNMMNGINNTKIGLNINGKINTKMNGSHMSKLNDRYTVMPGASTGRSFESSLKKPGFEEHIFSPLFVNSCIRLFSNVIQSYGNGVVENEKNEITQNNEYKQEYKCENEYNHNQNQKYEYKQEYKCENEYNHNQNQKYEYNQEYQYSHEYKNKYQLCEFSVLISFLSEEVILQKSGCSCLLKLCKLRPTFIEDFGIVLASNLVDRMGALDLVGSEELAKDHIGLISLFFKNKYLDILYEAWDRSNRKGKMVDCLLLQIETNLNRPKLHTSLLKLLLVLIQSTVRTNSHTVNSSNISNMLTNGFNKSNMLNGYKDEEKNKEKDKGSEKKDKDNMNNKDSGNNLTESNKSKSNNEDKEKEEKNLSVYFEKEFYTVTYQIMIRMLKGNISTRSISIVSRVVGYSFILLPMDENTRAKRFALLLKHVNSEDPQVRLVTIRTLLVIMTELPGQVVWKRYASLVVLALLPQLVSEDDPGCRKFLQILVIHIWTSGNKDNKNELLDIVAHFVRKMKKHVQLAISFFVYLSLKNENSLHNFNRLNLKVLTNFVDEINDDHWQNCYYWLMLLEHMISIQFDITKQPASSIWEFVLNTGLSSKHPWVLSSSLRTFSKVLLSKKLHTLVPNLSVRLFTLLNSSFRNLSTYFGSIERHKKLELAVYEVFVNCIDLVTNSNSNPKPNSNSNSNFGVKEKCLERLTSKLCYVLRCDLGRKSECKQRINVLLDIFSHLVTKEVIYGPKQRVTLLKIIIAVFRVAHTKSAGISYKKVKYMKEIDTSQTEKASGILDRIENSFNNSDGKNKNSPAEYLKLLSFARNFVLKSRLVKKKQIALSMVTNTKLAALKKIRKNKLKRRKIKH